MRLLCLCLIAACSSPTASTSTTPAPVQPASLPAAAIEAPFTPPPADQACSDSVLPDDSSSEFYDALRVGKAKNACSVADDNLARDEAAIVKGGARAAANSKPWDGKSKVARRDAVERRFAVDKAESAMLDKNGVVVLARVELPTYSHGYHEIFQSQLPVYITADSIFHAVYASHDEIVEEIETRRLAPLLAEALNTMHCALPTAAADYPRDVARDLDLYLTVARSLAEGEQVAGKLGDDANARDAKALIEKITAASALDQAMLFGRTRAIDFTQYLPRGHYAKEEPMQRYFRAAMWTSRLEFNLVSRSSRSSLTGEPDPKETPREAIAALALADLAARSGADKHVATVERAWTLLAGRREDVTLAQLGELRAKAGIRSLRDPAAFEALKTAIGGGYKRTTRVHPMPEGSRELPVIATLIGPRIVADAQAIMPLVNTAVPKRMLVGVADVAYMLGHDHGKQYLANELAKHPNLATQLDIARKTVEAAPDSGDLYSAWLAAIRALSAVPAGVKPSFVDKQAGKDLRINTVAAAYGQLKHNYVLMAGQPYSEFGCEIPDGFVEPVPAVYRALGEYAARGEAMAALLDPKDTLAVKKHFARVGAVMKLLEAIAADELADRPLTTVQKRWLGMVAELSLSPEDVTGHPPQYTGWYFDLFYHREGDGMSPADFIADYLTSQDGIAYVGATAPRMGIFVVDTSGGPRAFAGPVARAYEVHGPLATRYTDESARALTAVDEPWAQSYTAPVPAKPPSYLMLRYTKKGVLLKADEALGPMTITILDHHRVKLATKRVDVKAGKTLVPLKHPKTGAVYIEWKGFRDWALAEAYGSIARRWGTPKDGSEEEYVGDDDE